MEKEIKDKNFCSICGKSYEGYGNNAEPINNGRCCDYCNAMIVIPRRIQEHQNKIEENKKLKLEPTNHSYYCECWETKRTSEYDNWKQFKEDEGLDYDLDYNLLFRFDIDFADDPEDEHYGTYTLKLHHALQRHGSEQWHAVIYNITQMDMPEIEQHLKKAKQHLLEMWKEIEE